MLPLLANNTYTVSDFKAVVQLLVDKSPVWLTCDDGVASVRKTSRGKLGGGGMKTAYGLEDDHRVVLLSSFQNLDRMIREEMSGAAFIRSLDVPTVELEKCHLSPDIDLTVQVPVLMSRDFKSYAVNSTFVLDSKNLYSSTDMPSDIATRMFGSRENALNASNWISVLDPGIKDMQKLRKNGFGAGEDQLNLVLNGPNGMFNRNPENWEFRLFIFDLTSKYVESEYSIKPELEWDSSSSSCDIFIKNAIWDVVSPKSYVLDPEGEVLFEELKALVRKMYPSDSTLKMKKENASVRTSNYMLATAFALIFICALSL